MNQVSIHPLACRLLALFAVACGQLQANGLPAVDLAGAKDQVLPIKKRAAALEIGNAYLSPANVDAYNQATAELKSPYEFEKAKPKIVEVVEEVEVETVETKYVYDDSSILDRIGANFSNQVRGTMSMGSKYYIQLKSGKLMKPGASFPVSIPEVKDKTYTVTLDAIDDDGFTLSVAGLSRKFPYVVNDDKSSGSVSRN
ncbi:hypothetical protein [Coraliomargarita akajimensis]|nr:hypothetical protein [Coraliomargarita akajimensis]